jgi:hypothetical protein
MKRLTAMEHWSKKLSAIESTFGQREQMLIEESASRKKPPAQEIRCISCHQNK